MPCARRPAVHFFGLGAIWRIRAFHALAAALTPLGVAGLTLGAFGASAAVIGMVSGVCSGVALFVLAGVSMINRTQRMPSR